MSRNNRVVIFGVTSAIAEKVARYLVERGDSVYCVGRDQNKLEVIIGDLRIRSHKDAYVGGEIVDLLSFSNHEALFESARKALGGIDAILVAHGSLPDQSLCQASFEHAKKEIETNAISVLSLLTHAANYFESLDKGTIAVISSVAGDRGRGSNYIYGASKGMVTIFLQGMRNRLYKKGVRVVTIKPGFVDTPMTADFSKNGPLWSHPDYIARGIVKAMDGGRDVVYLPPYWAFIMFFIKCIPEFVFKRMSL